MLIPHQRHPDRLRLAGWNGRTQKRAEKEPEKEGETALTAAICVESNVSGGGRQEAGAFSLTAEVWDGGWRAAAAGRCLLRSLLKPILSVTAGGSGEHRRPAEETESKSMERLETILSLGTTLTLTPLSCSLYLSLTPFYFHSPTNT